MKKITLLTLFLISVICFSQEKFSYNIEGLSPKFVVLDFPDKTQSELYRSTINWIKDHYRNPNEVIKSQIENTRIRLEGSNPKGICVKILGIKECHPTKYVTEFEFKDGKLRIIPTAIQYYSTSTYNISEKEWSPVNLDTGFGVYNKKGKVRGMFSTYVESIENLANNPIASLKSYIEKGKDDSANSDW